MKPICLSSARPWITGGLLLAWSVTVSGLLTTKAQAEWYVGGYGGVAAPGGLSNTTVSDPTLGGGVTNESLIGEHAGERAVESHERQRQQQRGGSKAYHGRHHIRSCVIRLTPLAQQRFHRR